MRAARSASLVRAITLSGRSLTLLTRCGLVSPSREDHDREQRRGGCRSTDQVDRETVGPDHVHQRQQERRDEERSQAHHCHERHAPQAFSRVRPYRLALLYRPVAELRRDQQPGGDEWSRGVERCGGEAIQARSAASGSIETGP